LVFGLWLLVFGTSVLELVSWDGSTEDQRPKSKDQSPYLEQSSDNKEQDPTQTAPLLPVSFS